MYCPIVTSVVDQDYKYPIKNNNNNFLDPYFIWDKLKIRLV